MSASGRLRVLAVASAATALACLALFLTHDAREALACAPPRSTHCGLGPALLTAFSAAIGVSAFLLAVGAWTLHLRAAGGRLPGPRAMALVAVALFVLGHVADFAGSRSARARCAEGYPCAPVGDLGAILYRLPGSSGAPRPPPSSSRSCSGPAAAGGTLREGA